MSDSQQTRLVEGPVPDECTTKLCHGDPEWAVAMRGGVSRHRGTEHELSPPVGAVCPFVCDKCRRERYAGIDDHRWVQVAEVATDGGQRDSTTTDNNDHGPERVVFLDGESATELLEEGDVTTTLFEESDEEGFLNRSEVTVINRAGPHPLYDDGGLLVDSGHDGDDRSLWTVFGTTLAAAGLATITAVGLMTLAFPATLTVNGDPMTLPGGQAFGMTLLVIGGVTVATITPRLVWWITDRFSGGESA